MLPVNFSEQKSSIPWTRYSVNFSVMVLSRLSGLPDEVSARCLTCSLLGCPLKDLLAAHVRLDRCSLQSGEFFLGLVSEFSLALFWIRQKRDMFLVFVAVLGKEASCIIFWGKSCSRNFLEKALYYYLKVFHFWSFFGKTWFSKKSLSFCF